MKKIVIYVSLLINSLVYCKNYDMKTYIIRKGDTLSKISQKTGISTKKLINLNCIKNPNLIYPGMKLKLSNNLTLTDAANSYEKQGDYILKNNKFGLDYKIKKSLENYEIARKINLNHDKNLLQLNKKIQKLTYLKKALKYENVGKIHAIKNEDHKALKNFNTALLYYEKYTYDNDFIIDTVDLKIKNIRTLI